MIGAANETTGGASVVGAVGTYVASGLNGAASVMMLFSLCYFGLLFTEFCIGDIVRKGITRVVDCIRRWLTVLSIVMLSLSIGIKGWNNSSVLTLTTSLQQSALGEVNAFVVGLNVLVLLMCVTTCIVVLRSRGTVVGSPVASGTEVPPVVSDGGAKASPIASSKTQDLEIKALLEQVLLRVAKLERGRNTRRESAGPSRTYAEVVEPAGAGEPRLPRDACGACGSHGHWRKDCPYKDFRCGQCGQLGHTVRACRNFAVKDKMGRVKQLVEVKDSRIRTEAARDHHMQDQVMTAQDVLESVLEKAKVRAHKAKSRRQAQSAGHETKRRVIEHPVGAAEEPQSDSEGSEGSEEEMEDIVSVLSSLVRRERDPKSSEL